MKKIAVLVPCYNEELTIRKVVDDFKKELPDADIYVYDNNSKDKTAQIAKEAGAVVVPEYRQGKGNVVPESHGIQQVIVLKDKTDFVPAQF